VKYAACTFGVAVFFMSQTQFNTEEGDSTFLPNMDELVRQYMAIEKEITQSGSLPL
jgi:hypothetical protein